MPDSPDWKQKYRDSLLEMEREEKRRGQIEQALRRLVGRLCAAGMGVDPQLDDELIALAAANRRNADVAELEKRAAALTSAVMAVDAVSPVPTIVLAPKVMAPGPKLPAPSTVTAARDTRWHATCAAAAKILKCLETVSGESAAAADLIEKLAQAQTDAELAALLVQAADLVHGFGASLARERAQAAEVLAGVGYRLEEVSNYLAESGHDARSRFDDSNAVNDSVILQVRELTAQVNSATDLGVLQTHLNARLETVTQQVLAFRSREEGRWVEQAGRTESMRSRIADLEREAQDLNSRLDRERHGARQDPLTRLANRKSFDERIAEALARRQPNDPPAALLLWDVDNFKGINDTYGHRAGDRVLQSVAACLSNGLRAEDFVARVGGEEFAVLLGGLPFLRVVEVADELRRGIEGLRLHFRGTPVRVTASCGLTELRSDDAADTAFERADAALYRAKHGGKNACIAA